VTRCNITNKQTNKQTMKISRSILVTALLLPTLSTAFAPPNLSSSNTTPFAASNGITSATATTTASSILLANNAKAKASVTALKMSDATANTADDVVVSANDDDNKPAPVTLFEMYTKAADVATNLFPVWTVLFTAIALKKPTAFDWFTTDYFTGALAALMLSMGITLTPEDFVAVAKEPKSVGVQFTLCYAMMPILALGLGKIFKLDPALMAGMVLVGSINGGQASNLCTYIAKGNVAMSVLMTTATTIGAIFMTPLICKLLLGSVVPVDAAGIAMSTIQVVLAPIAVGMSMNKFLPSLVKKILPFAPVVGVISTCLLVASAVAQVAQPIMNAGLSLQFPVLLLHLIGGLVGYWLPKIGGFGEITSRTMAIETSMKSSAFGFLLAKLHFGEYAARVPSAVSVVWMALTGATLAVIWRGIPVKEGE